MKSVTLVFPHQLFADHPAVNDAHVYLIEVNLMFTQFPFHKQKLAYHRATMKAYAERIADRVRSLHYVEARDAASEVSRLIVNWQQMAWLWCSVLTWWMTGYSNSWNKPVRTMTCN